MLETLTEMSGSALRRGVAGDDRIRDQDMAGVANVEPAALGSDSVVALPLRVQLVSVTV